MARARRRIRRYDFVPDKLLSQFIETMEGTFGEHCCNVLDIRPEGAAVLRLE